MKRTLYLLSLTILALQPSAQLVDATDARPSIASGVQERVRAPVSTKKLQPMRLSSPTAIIQKYGTAGMPLEGGAKVVVKNGNVMIQSGKKLSPLISAPSSSIIIGNRSKLPNAQIEPHLNMAIQSKFGALARQSYKTRSVVRSEKARGKLKEVLVDIDFLHKDTWLAESKSLLLTFEQTPRGLVLKSTVERPVAAVAREQLRPIAGAKRSAAVKKSGIKLRPSPAIMAKAKPDTPLKLLPIYELIKDLKIVPIGPSALALANTAYPEVVTAKQANDQVAALFQAYIGSTAKLDTKATSTKEAILNYLRNGQMLAWNNIGHGNPTKICQGNGDIYYTDLPADTLARGINGCVCLVNSCQTFNDPLKARILLHEPRTYMAGIVNLPMVTSEGSNPVFWTKVLVDRKPMSVAFAETNTGSGLTGYWGFHGDGGVF